MNTEKPADNVENFKLWIDDGAWDKIMYLVDKAPGEISGLGLIVPYQGGWRVTETFLLPQENSASATDIEAADVAKLEHRVKDKEGALRFWWHSHANMETFWSNTDIETIEMLGRHGWFLSTVVNKKHSRLSAFYGGKLLSGSAMFMGDIPTKILKTYNTDVRKAWDEEYDENVIVKTYATHYGSGGYNSWGKGPTDFCLADAGMSPTDFRAITGCDFMHTPNGSCAGPKTISQKRYHRCKWSTVWGAFKDPIDNVWWDWDKDEWVCFEKLSHAVLLRNKKQKKKSKKAPSSKSKTKKSNSSWNAKSGNINDLYDDPEFGKWNSNDPKWQQLFGISDEQWEQAVANGDIDWDAYGRAMGDLT